VFSIRSLSAVGRYPVFGQERDGVAGGWRKLHNEELHNLYSSPSIIRMIKSRRMRRAGHVVHMGRRGMGKPEGKTPLGRPRNRWEDDIKLDIGEIGWGDMDRIELEEVRDQWMALVNTVMNLRDP
jgi:hypothetical protein